MAELTLIYGDPYLVRERASAVIQSFDVGEIQAIQAPASPQEAIEKGSSLPFMDPYTLIHIRNVITAEASKSKDSAGTRQWADAIESLAAMPPTTIYVWTEDNLPSNSRLLTLARKHAKAEHLPTPKAAVLPGWARDRAQELGCQLTQDAAEALVQRTGPSVWRITNEIEKIALWSQGELARRADVNLLVQDSSEAVIFRAIDDLFAGNRRRATRQFEATINSGQSAQYIVAMLQREARMMAVTQAMDQQGSDTSQIMEALGTGSDYVVRKARQHIQAAGPDAPAAWYDLLADADRLIKTSSISPENAVMCMAALLAPNRDD